MDAFLIALALVWLIAASFQDIKKREVYNWLSFSLIIFVLIYRGIYSILFSNLMFFFSAIIGFFIFYVVANILYYGRFFAGGDAKLFMALGTVLAVSTSFLANIRVFLVFLFLMFLVGALYSFVYSFFLLKRGFFSGLKKYYCSNRGLFNLSLLGCLLFLILGLFYNLFLLLAILLFIFPFLYVYAKTIEEFLIKEVSGKQLSEGDWLVQDIKIGKKTISKSWEGLTKEQLKLLRNKKKVKIKNGIPFVPVFLISFIILVLWYPYGGFFKFFYF